MDKEITTIREFVTFAHEILGKKNKKAANLYRFVSKPDTLGEQQILDIKKAASQCFSTITQWSDFTGKNFIQYKSGYLSLGELERKCAKNPDDLKVFNEYIEVIRALYFDIQKNLTEFISKLHLEDGSPEAEFMSSLFNEVGGEIIEVIKGGGGTQDVASLLPKVFEMVKSGKILEVMEKLKDGTVKISKILKAFAVLVEDFENAEDE
jgi:hypothetical protein